MTSSKKRGLKPEEIELWDKVRQSTVPLHPKKKAAIVEAINKISGVKQANRPEIPRFRVGQSADLARLSQPVAVGYSKRPDIARVLMDSKSFTKMKKGKLSPEARIDLHGMTLDQAHPALMGFILQAYSQQKRLVLVITGKGRQKDDFGPIPVRKGVLKHNVPAWLRAAPMQTIVLQITESHFRHGGSGAYYVYLRRNR